MTSLTASVTKVQLGLLEIDGLLASDGNFYVGVPQLADLGLVPPNRSQKQLEALLDITFQSHQKAKTTLNPKAVNVIGLDDVVSLIKAQFKKGNTQAIAISEALIGLSLQQLFCDAFGVKFEAADRQEWLKARVSGKKSRRNLTDAIRDYITKNEITSENYITWVYPNVTDCCYKAIFGKKAKQLREDKGVKDNNQLRDALSHEELTAVERREDFAMRLIDKSDTEPLEAMRQSVEFYS